VGKRHGHIHSCDGPSPVPYGRRQQVPGKRFAAANFHGWRAPRLFAGILCTATRFGLPAALAAPVPQERTVGLASSGRLTSSPHPAGSPNAPHVPFRRNGFDRQRPGPPRLLVPLVLPVMGVGALRWPGSPPARRTNPIAMEPVWPAERCGWSSA